MEKKLSIFKKILKRITGISTPIIGISWNPPELERDTVKRLLTIFEDQRLLFGDYKILFQHPQYVEEALYRLRNQLSEELKNLERSTELSKSISTMRAACRKCLDQIQKYKHHSLNNYHVEHIVDLPMPISYFWAIIGELRAIFGIHISQLCTKYGFNIVKELESILPPS